jgi:hypothetical protein
VLVVFEHFQLVKPFVFHFLFLDISPDSFLIPSSRRYKISSRPEILPREIVPFPQMRPGYRYRALPLDVSYHGRYPMLRRYFYQHMDVI